MQLIGQPVKHATYGKGVITQQSDRAVTVDFAQGEKRFVYPDAFSHFLTLKDARAQQAVAASCHQKEQKRELVKKEEYHEWEHLHELRCLKISPVSQAVFDVDPAQLTEILANGWLPSGTYVGGCSKGQPRIPNRIRPNTACLLTTLPESGKEADRQILGVSMVRDDFHGNRCRDGHVPLHEHFRIVLPDGLTLRYWDYPEKKSFSH